MEASILHNKTLDDCRDNMRPRDGDEHTAQRGDRLRLVGSLSFDALVPPHEIAHRAFHAGISIPPYDENAARDYRSWHVRRLRPGDVIVVSDDCKRSTAYSVAEDRWMFRPISRSNARWKPLDLRDFELVDALRISVRLDNCYERYGEIRTTVHDAVLPMPPTFNANDKSYHEWALERLFQLTGTGRTDGDAMYFVEIFSCSQPQMVGRRYEFG